MVEETARLRIQRGDRIHILRNEFKIGDALAQHLQGAFQYIFFIRASIWHLQPAAAEIVAATRFIGSAVLLGPSPPRSQYLDLGSCLLDLAQIVGGEFDVQRSHVLLKPVQLARTRDSESPNSLLSPLIGDGFKWIIMFDRRIRKTDSSQNIAYFCSYLYFLLINC
jgi:hypothetical protein